MAVLALRGLSGSPLGDTGPTPWGAWLDPMYVELLTTNGRDIQVFTAVRFVDKHGVVHTIPHGFVSDGASIPKKAWSLVGGPLSGKYRRASVLHDKLLQERLMSVELAHALFYDAMRADGVTAEQADLFYNAVVAATWWSRIGALRALATASWRVVRRVIPRI